MGWLLGRSQEAAVGERGTSIIYYLPLYCTEFDYVLLH